MSIDRTALNYSLEDMETFCSLAAGKVFEFARAAFDNMPPGSVYTKEQIVNCLDAALAVGATVSHQTIAFTSKEKP